MTERERYRDAHPYREPARGEFGHDLSEVEIDRALAADYEAWEAKADHIKVRRISIRIYLEHGPDVYLSPWIDETLSTGAQADEEQRVMELVWKVVCDTGAVLTLPTAHDRIRMIPSHNIASVEAIETITWADEATLYAGDE